MIKKYELLKHDTTTIGETTLYRIKALRDFSDVKAGDCGGYIESEDNLSHEGDCWVYGFAKVHDRSRVSENGKIYDNAQMHGKSQLYDDAKIVADVKIFDNVQVYGKAELRGKTHLYNNVQVYDRAVINGNSKIYGDVQVYKDSILEGVNIKYDIHRTGRR